MIGVILLIAAFSTVTALVIWADVRGFDPWPWLYGSSDPRELVERARERGER